MSLDPHCTVTTISSLWTSKPDQQQPVTYNPHHQNGAQAQPSNSDALELPETNGVLPSSETTPNVGSPENSTGASVEESADKDADGAGGVHAVTRNTDYWFEREIGVIERDARVAAEQWAARGLPRHDVPRTEPLEPEQVLTARCAQLFRDWQRRVRTKMQDAIEAASGGRRTCCRIAQCTNPT